MACSADQTAIALTQGAAFSNRQETPQETLRTSGFPARHIKVRPSAALHYAADECSLKGAPTPLLHQRGCRLSVALRAQPSKAAGDAARLACLLATSECAPKLQVSLQLNTAHQHSSAPVSVTVRAKHGRLLCESAGDAMLVGLCAPVRALTCLRLKVLCRQQRQLAR